MASSYLWGGNPEKDALYLNVVPDANDGKTVHRLHLGDVPVDGFWSISIYNAKGYFEANTRNSYSINSLTAKKDEFGGCDDKVSNCITITPGWNYIVRLYRPRPEVLQGRWTFPTAEPVH